MAYWLCVCGVRLPYHIRMLSILVAIAGHFCGSVIIGPWKFSFFLSNVFAGSIPSNSKDTTIYFEKQSEKNTSLFLQSIARYRLQLNRLNIWRLCSAFGTPPRTKHSYNTQHFWIQKANVIEKQSKQKKHEIVIHTIKIKETSFIYQHDNGMKSHILPGFNIS